MLEDTRKRGMGYFRETYRHVLPDLSELVVEREWESDFAWGIEHRVEGWNVT
jgi:hypothetical protein